MTDITMHITVLRCTAYCKHRFRNSSKIINHLTFRLRGGDFFLVIDDALESTVPAKIQSM